LQARGLWHHSTPGAEPFWDLVESNKEEEEDASCSSLLVLVPRAGLWPAEPMTVTTSTPHVSTQEDDACLQAAIGKMNTHCGGGHIFEIHGLLYHSTLDAQAFWDLIASKKEEG